MSAEIFSPSFFTLFFNGVLTVLLVAIAAVDVREYRIPDRLSLPLIGIGLLAARLVSPQPFSNHLIGAALGYLSLALFGEIFFRLRGREGLGLGDAKLFAAAGAWLGWAALPAVLLIAALSGLLFAGALKLRGKFTGRVPFGPFLGLGLWLTWNFGSPFY